ncbi:MAG: D-alanine--D-alanine ligase [Alphaproteobacteria bacterium]
MNIVLLFGGYTERDVSIMSAKEVESSLKRLGHKVTKIDISKEDFCYYSENNIDLIFNSLHGGIGENGIIQSVCELKSIPYTGSAVLASAIAMNKVLAKKVFNSMNINTANSLVSNINDIKKNEPMERPYVIKPIDGGSSLGVNIIKKDSNLDRLELSDKNILVETYVAGKEIAVAIIENHILGMIEIQHDEIFYDYKSKYKSSRTKYVIPKNIGAYQKELLESFSLSAHKILGCKGVTRADFIVPDEPSIQPVLLEINTLPGLTKHSLVPKIAQNNGINFDDLISMIIKDALI